MSSVELISRDLSVWPREWGMRLTQADVYQLHADFSVASSLGEFPLHELKASVYGTRVDQISMGIEVNRLACHYVLRGDPSYFSEMALYIAKHSIMPLAVLLECALAGLDVATSYLCFRFALLEVPKGSSRFTEKNFRRLSCSAARLCRGASPERYAPASSFSEVAA